MKQLTTLFILIMTTILTNAQAEPKELNYTNQVFTAVDVETTGLNARYDKIIELAAVKFKNGNIIETKSWLINPKIAIPEYSRNVHGITDEMVADKPTFDVAITNFTDFIEDSIIIAHNATFDAGFIYTEMINNNIERMTNPFLDSLKMARLWYPESNKHNLKFLSEYLGFEGETYHRALDDSIYVKLLFIDGVEKNQKYKDIRYLIRKTGINQHQVLKKLRKK